MTMVANASPRAGTNLNRQQRRQAARLAKNGRRGNGAATGGLAFGEETARELAAAVRFHQTGEFQNAAEIYRRILDRHPDHFDALHHLGLIALQAGQNERAIDLIGRALAINPKFAAAHNSLGAALQMQGNLTEAANCYQRAAAIDPKNARTQNNLGIVLQVSGRLDEAIVAFENALALKPDYAMPYKGLAALRKVLPDDGLISGIQRLLREDKLPGDDRCYLNFALGKCFDDIGEFDRAFHHYQAGNDIHKQKRPFDVAAFAEKTDEIIATFTPAFFSERAAVGNNSEQPVFIVGMPRSGTTLIEQILASHPAVFGADELPYFNQMAADLQAMLRDATAYPACAARIDEATAGRLAQRYLDHLRKRSGDAARVTDKMPDNFRNLGLIALLFPRARVIHCRRDPLDVCLSCYFQDFTNLPFSYDLADIGQYYRKYEQLMAHWWSALPLQILDLRYEELVADEETVSRRMVDFCGLDWDDACLTFHENDRPVQTASKWQVRQPIYKTSVARWKRYERHLGPLKAALDDTHWSGGSSDDRPPGRSEAGKIYPI